MCAHAGAWWDVLGPAFACTGAHWGNLQPSVCSYGSPVQCQVLRAMSPSPGPCPHPQCHVPVHACTGAWCSDLRPSTCPRGCPAQRPMSPWVPGAVSQSTKSQPVFVQVPNAVTPSVGFGGTRPDRPSIPSAHPLLMVVNGVSPSFASAPTFSFRSQSKRRCRYGWFFFRGSL